MRVMAAMSGGVDSSVAAARLVAEGHEVIGVHLALASTPTTLRVGSRGCCSLEDSGDARRVADVLGIPFYVWDFSDRFREDVVDPFINSYEMGETPNPCLRCNEKIKFQALLDRGIALGFDAVATGHYARLKDGELRRAIDDKKDQSYVLGVLNDEQLAHCLFPLGDTRKPDIRKEAEAAGLVTASKPDSHDICFIPDGNTKAFLGNHIGVRSGDLKDQDGNVIGHHDGIYGFTIGQRKGLGLPGPAPDGKPRYVTDIDADAGTVTVGTRDDLRVGRLYADRLIRLNEHEGSTQECQVQVRAHGGVVDATVSIDDGVATIELHSPLTGVARGQAAVIYRPDPDGDIVLGSGTICDTVSVSKLHPTTAGASSNN